MRILVTLLCLIGVPALACPPLPDITAEQTAIIDRIKSADTQIAAQDAVGELWQLWFQAPDKQAQDWLDDGMARIRQADFSRAEEILAGLVAYCPEYGEGYNQLAFAQFLQEDLDASEVNLMRTLELVPDHMGALSGLGLIAQKRGDIALAKIWIRRAVAIYPYMSERFILDLPEPTDDL